MLGIPTFPPRWRSETDKNQEVHEVTMPMSDLTRKEEGDSSVAMSTSCAVNCGDASFGNCHACWGELSDGTDT